jgi:hypothetical protein
MKPDFLQEQTEGAEMEKKNSVSSVTSCSNPFVPSSGRKSMKPGSQQERAEAAEPAPKISAFSAPSCSIRFVMGISITSVAFC